jgi:hypothetical protein
MLTDFNPHLCLWLLFPSWESQCGTLNACSCGSNWTANHVTPALHKSLLIWLITTLKTPHISVSFLIAWVPTRFSPKRLIIVQAVSIFTTSSCAYSHRQSWHLKWILSSGPSCFWRLTTTHTLSVLNAYRIYNAVSFSILILFTSPNQSTYSFINCINLKEPLWGFSIDVLNLTYCHLFLYFPRFVM